MSRFGSAALAAVLLGTTGLALVSPSAAQPGGDQSGVRTGFVVGQPSSATRPPAPAGRSPS